MSILHIIWFRNDLRVHDNAALRGACFTAERDGGDVLALVIEDPSAPEEWQARSAALRDLSAALEQRGARLHIRSGTPSDVFSELHRAHGVRSVHMNEVPFDDAETSNTQSWALRAGVRFQVYSQYGPEDAPLPYEATGTDWTKFMARPKFETPDIPSPANVGVGQNLIAEDASASEEETVGGRRQAIELLRGFLGSVADPQRIAITEAESGAAFFERMKPFLLLGVLSLREVWQAASSAHYQMHQAGQDIRAASIKSLLRRLPELHQRRASVRTVRMARNVRQGGAKGEQLSLGL
ncbi:MAG: hypothetical protein Hens2KO_25010 [Henriciella sp.]